MGGVLFLSLLLFFCTSDARTVKICRTSHWLMAFHNVFKILTTIFISLFLFFSVVKSNIKKKKASCFIEKKQQGRSGVFPLITGEWFSVLQCFNKTIPVSSCAADAVYLNSRALLSATLLWLGMQLKGSMRISLEGNTCVVCLGFAGLQIRLGQMWQTLFSMAVFIFQWVKLRY